MRYQVQFTSSAEKDLRKLSKDMQQRIAAEIERLSENPRHLNTKRLRASRYYRTRVGDYRLIYEIEDEVLTIMVIKIGHRREVYR
jgi:mRNA interferase RelE/StbE